VVFGDSIIAHHVSRSLNAETLRSLTTIAGGEPLCMAEVRDVGLTSPGPDPATDEAVEQFDRLANVHSLWLSRSEVTDTALERLATAPQLGVLHLRGSRITDRGLEPLKRCTHLRVLSLHQTAVTDAGVRDIQRALPRCRIYR